jgi:hypothetical protein
MAAELEKLRKDTAELSKQFRNSGQPELADLLELDARGFRMKAKMAESRGIKTFAPATVVESPVQPEAPINPVRFTEQEREALINDGAVLYLPTGQTIKDQIAAGRKFWHLLN